MTLRSALASTVLSTLAAASCSSSLPGGPPAPGGNAGGSTGAGAFSGAGGLTGAGNSGAAGDCGQGGCSCPAAAPNPTFACPSGSTAFACDVNSARELRASKDHAYLVVDTVFYRVGDTGLEPLFDLRIQPGNFGHDSLHVQEPYVYFAQGNSALPSEVPPPKQPLYRRLLDGSDDPSVVWDCSNYTNDFALDGDSIFTSGTSGVLRIENRVRAVGATQLLPTGFNPGWDMRVDDSGLYWASSEGLTRSGKTSACACTCGASGSAACPTAGGLAGAAGNGAGGSAVGGAGGSAVGGAGGSAVGGAGGSAVGGAGGGVVGGAGGVVGGAGGGAVGGAGGQGPTFPCAQPTQLLSTPQFVYHFVLDRDWVYFVSTGSLFRVTKSGGNPEAILEAGVGPWTVQNLAANASDIYVTAIDSAAKEWQLLRIPRGGRDATVLARSAIENGSSGTVWQMVATTDHVYWLEGFSCTTKLRRYRIGP